LVGWYSTTFKEIWYQFRTNPLIGCRDLILSKFLDFDILIFIHDIFVPYDRANLRTFRYEDLKPIGVKLAELLQ
jgi:hypothetical protein